MGQTSLQIQARLIREYYKDFSKYSKGRPASRPVAWVTAFTPVEILEALDIEYVYPESYAAVIAASNREQDAITESEDRSLCRDCCSYSCSYNGALALKNAPRGCPPAADILIATNNQCDTLPNWWNALSKELDIPLIVLDYPGETEDEASAYEYVTRQHRSLITALEEMSGNKLSEEKLSDAITNSIRSVSAWNRVVEMLPSRSISPTTLFDGMSYLITSRCKPETADLYGVMAEELKSAPEADLSKPGLFWLGYPLWYHPGRYLDELCKDFRICGSNYITWWSMDYTGASPMERLFSAYNFTFLNLRPEMKRERLLGCLKASGAAAAVVLHNKSCKCDFVSARHISIPQAEIDIDMIDRSFLDEKKAKRQLELLYESVCIR